MFVYVLGSLRRIKESYLPNSFCYNFFRSDHKISSDLLRIFCKCSSSNVQRQLGFRYGWPVGFNFQRTSASASRVSFWIGVFIKYSSNIPRIPRIPRIFREHHSLNVFNQDRPMHRFSNDAIWQIRFTIYDLPNTTH